MLNRTSSREVTWTSLRQRLPYLAASVFLAWHTLAIVVAPMPGGGELVQMLRAVLQPYLTLFGLDNPWNFFAPRIGASQPRYFIENAAGERLAIAPTQHLSWFHPEYTWFRDLHYSVAGNPDLYAEPAAAMLCRQHAAFNPVSVTFLDYEQGNFTPQDYLSGKHPMDPELVTMFPVRTVRCPSP